MTGKPHRSEREPPAPVVRPPSPIPAPVAETRQSAVLADLDTQLMLQVRGGDRDAAGALIRRNTERVARYISRLVRDERTVEDLTQDVFLQALRQAERYEPTARVSTWLYRIATNTALNYLKRPSVRQRPMLEERDTFDVPDCRLAPPDRQMSLDELRDRVAAAIDSLPVNQRIALTLFQYEDCSYEQIAEVLNVTIEAVRSLLTRARTSLRTALGDLMQSE